jgi:hypothetical protein
MSFQMDTRRTLERTLAFLIFFNSVFFKKKKKNARESHALKTDINLINWIEKISKLEENCPFFFSSS